MSIITPYRQEEELHFDKRDELKYYLTQRIKHLKPKQMLEIIWKSSTNDDSGILVRHIFKQCSMIFEEASRKVTHIYTITILGKGSCDPDSKLTPSPLKVFMSPENHCINHPDSRLYTHTYFEKLDVSTDSVIFIKRIFL